MPSAHRTQVMLGIPMTARSIVPMRLLRIPEPFDSRDFIFEPKLDGFRALTQVRGHR